MQCNRRGFGLTRWLRVQSSNKMHRHLGTVFVAAILSMSTVPQLRSQQIIPHLVQPADNELDDAGRDTDQGNTMFNIKTSTLGGKQFWTDYAWRQGWRIQLHAIMGHWRLLDNKNVRHAWGDRQHCVQVLNQLVPDNTLPVQEVIILLHGLGRSSTSMRSLGRHLGTELQMVPIYFEYASTRHSISGHAQALSEFIQSLPTNVSLNFVGHSMGNIVVRHYLGDLQRAGRNSDLERVQSVVMLGPPNQGASIARLLAKTGVFGWFVGDGGMELGPDWTELEKRLATPTCPFGIIAGKLPDPVPDNPLVGGEGDFVVSVEETRLEGATDSMIVPRLHSFLMDAPEVQTATAQFIKTRSKFVGP